MWSSLESSHGLIHVAADWRARLGQHFTAFNANFLQRTPHLATSYPCPRGCGCMHRVAQRSPSSFTASCRCNPSAGPDLVLTPDDVALFELSWPRLARALCSALGLNPKPTRFILPNTCQIGAWSPAAVPAILTIQSDPARFRNKISGLAAKLRQPFIFLAPTSNHLDVRALEPLHQARAGFFDLASHITMTPNGSLHSKETLAASSPGSPLSLSSRTNPSPATPSP